MSSLNLSQATFFPLPGQFQDRPMTIRVWGGSRWTQIADYLGYVFGADPSALGSHDCYFGEDDESVDVLTIRGEIVGSFDRALSASEWADLLSVSGNIVRARAA